jgi:hypothetical protein
VSYEALCQNLNRLVYPKSPVKHNLCLQGVKDITEVELTLAPTTHALKQRLDVRQ